MHEEIRHIMTNPATRLLTLIGLLQQKPNQKAADLAAALHVSVRTLHRYLAMLEEMGLPVMSERGPHGGFSLVRGYRMPPLIFSPDEAVAITLGASLVKEVWGELLAKSAHSALTKLTNVMPHEQLGEIEEAQRSMSVVGLTRAAPGALDPLLQTLRQGIRESRQVEISYRSRQQLAFAKRVIEPYGLTYRWGWWYAVSYCQTRQDVRSFRVDRMGSANLLDKRFVRPADFNLQGFLNSESYFNSGLTVTLRFWPDGVHLAEDNRYSWETMVAQPDGSLLVTFTTPDIHWAGSLALGFGAHVEVLGPAELRAHVANQIQSLTEVYRTSGP